MLPEFTKAACYEQERDAYFSKSKNLKQHEFVFEANECSSDINPSRPNPGRREKFKLNFIFTFLCGASKDFMKALKAFIKPFEVSQKKCDNKSLT